MQCRDHREHQAAQDQEVVRDYDVTILRGGWSMDLFINAENHRTWYSDTTQPTLRKPDNITVLGTYLFSFEENM